MNKQLLEDLIGYISFAYDQTSKTHKQKLDAIVTTVLHDLYGTLNEDRCFRPRTQGYADLNNRRLAGSI